jgi:hypothetical protein
VIGIILLQDSKLKVPKEEGKRMEIAMKSKEDLTLLPGPVA